MHTERIPKRQPLISRLFSTSMYFQGALSDNSEQRTSVGGLSMKSWKPGMID